MKCLACVVVYVLLCTRLYAQVHPGIKVEAFKEKIPGVIPNKVYYDEDLQISQKLWAFDGKWYLDFQHDSLKEIYYSDNLGLNPKGTMAAFDSVVKKYTSLMGDAAWKKNAADQELGVDRKRKENMDTIRTVCWKTRFAEVVVGLYLTGNKKIKMTPEEKALQNIINGEHAYNYYQFNIHVKKADHRSLVHAWNLYPGLNIYKVMELKPDYFPNGPGINGQWGKKENIHGLEGNRYFDFEASTLVRTVWNYYEGKQDKASFEKCLKATQAIVQEYTALYGTPVIVQGETKYKDPYKREHWGYDVLKATWDMNTYTIEVYYTFMGGKGRYDLLVKIEEEQKK